MPAIAKIVACAFDLPCEHSSVAKRDVDSVLKFRVEMYQSIVAARSANREHRQRARVQSRRFSGSLEPPKSGAREGLVALTGASGRGRPLPGRHSLQAWICSSLELNGKGPIAPGDFEDSPHPWGWGAQYQLSAERSEPSLIVAEHSETARIHESHRRHVDNHVGVTANDGPYDASPSSGAVAMSSSPATAIARTFG